MNLSDVSAYLPEAVLSQQALRIQKFLLQVDTELGCDCTIAVYGSAAVTLYRADDSDAHEYGYTYDIDVARSSPKELDLSGHVDSSSYDPPLEFQYYDVERWLVHPDWKEALIDMTALLGTQNLRVCLLHPIDLVVTKLARCNSQDLEDGQSLRERYVSDTAIVRDRLLEAVKYWPGSDRERSQVEYAFEGVFEEKISLP